MKLVILGANGRTGVHVVEQALAEGAEVTAVVRSDAARPGRARERLGIVVGDPCDPQVLTEVFRGQDAVISTLGGRRPTRRATSVYPRSAAAIVDAAWNARIRRVAVTSTALLFPPARRTDRVLAALVPRVVESAAAMERTLRAADLDLVIARCGFLTDAPARGYVALPDRLPDGGTSVPRGALARFLLDAVNRTGGGPQVWGVAGARHPT